MSVGGDLGAQPAVALPPVRPLAGARHGRVAVNLIFAVHGVISGTFAARVPWIQSHIHASPGVLGAALITETAGALAAMPATARVVHRFGAKTGMRILIALYCASLAVPALMPGAWSLAAVLFVFGATAGCADVAMNGHAVRVESRAGRSIMSGFHGLWAVGMIAGSVLGGLAAAAGIGAPAEFAATAAAFAVLGVASCALLPPNDPASPEVAAPHYALPSKAILFVGVVGFCGIFAEGAARSWCAVYLTDVTHTTAALGAYSLTGFSVTLALGRLTGDAVARRLGAVLTVRIGGAVAVAGMCMVALAHSPALGMLGFAAVGLGIATSVPLAIAATGRLGGNAESAVAGITTIMYAAGLVAGPSVGALGSAVSLPFAFWVTAVVTSGIALSARALRPA
ncbi:MFS transporter [Actinocrinis puniceicyclus]|uniref:MFS transporter n=1 Tax=Actinocrinis puniceicyclus TaxID=977794 RepID=A0A8J8BC43_9ACTN|nr:MFS transporter [Actinocrinis puniceicyclus]MBS2963743.1 MFS transporter [Actinocrinis puniceicyclus]